MHIHIASQFRNWPETLSHSNLCSSSFSLYANDPRKAHVYQDTRHQVQCPNKKKLFWCPWASIRHVQCQQLKNYLLCITKLFRLFQKLSNSQFRDLTTCVPKPPSHTGRMQRVTTNVRLANMPPGRRTQNIKPTELVRSVGTQGHIVGLRCGSQTMEMTKTIKGLDLFKYTQESNLPSFNLNRLILYTYTLHVFQPSRQICSFLNSFPTQP